MRLPNQCAVVCVAKCVRNRVCGGSHSELSQYDCDFSSRVQFNCTAPNILWLICCLVLDLSAIYFHYSQHQLRTGIV